MPQKQTPAYGAYRCTVPYLTAAPLRRVGVLKSALAVYLMGSALAAAAAPFYLVVPLKAQSRAQEPAEPITVSLAGAALPAARVNQAYSESLRPYLSVTGDAAFDAATARWSMAEGALPAGLALDPTTGAVIGLPTAKTTSPASFTVLATYKGENGQAVYTLEVGGQLLKASQIASGRSHTCAITEAGGMVCWGQNNQGQLGDGTLTMRRTPVSVIGLGSGVSRLVAGAVYTCAVTTQGQAKCWGSNSYGQLGDGTLVQRNTPVEVTGLPAAVASIAAGGAHSCVVTTEGGLLCWGSNGNGQLGDGTTVVERRTPEYVSGMSSRVRSVVVGTSHTCAVTVTGAAKCWGNNSEGLLGDGTTTQSHTPVQVTGLSSGVSSLAASASHTCAVTTAGGVQCWGSNSSGQLGHGSASYSSSTPVPVSGLNSGVTSVAATGVRTCAAASGAAKCWGYNYGGLLGDGTTTDSPTPVQVIGLSAGVTSLALGANHTCASTTDGAVKCWGQNSFGQLGNNSTSASTVPVAVEGIQ